MHASGTVPAALPGPVVSGDAALAGLAEALAASGWDCLAHESCEGEAMLVATAPDGATWLLSRAPAGLRAQRMEGEAWLATECEGPPARVLARMLG